MKQKPSFPWARWPANISYAVFLWHPLVISWLVGAGLDGPPLVIAAVCAVVAIATASYVLLERPALRLAASWIRERRSRTSAVIATVSS